MISYIDLLRFPFNNPQASSRMALEDLTIDLTKPVEMEADNAYFLKLGGAGVIHRGAITSIQGKPKSGKSSALSLMVMAILSSDGAGPFTPAAKGDAPSILWLDTEQDKSTIHTRAVDMLQRAQVPLLPPDKASIRFVSLAPCTIDERREMLMSHVEAQRPQLVIIDGVADLVKNVNDEAECSGLLDKIVSSGSKHGTAFVCVIHENKSSENSKGHLGSFLNQKAGQVFGASRKAGYYEVKCIYSRYSSIERAWGFTYEDGRPVFEDKAIDALTEAQKAAEEQERLRGLLESCLRQGQPYTPKELNLILAERSGQSESTARRLVKQAEEVGFLESSGSTSCRRYRLVPEAPHDYPQKPT